MRLITYCIVFMGCLFLTISCGENETLEMENEIIKNWGALDNSSTFVSEKKAEETAKIFMKQLSGKASTRSNSESPNIETVCKDGKPLMYVLNYSNGSFVIVSASKDYYPILAYSDEFNFDISSGINGVMSWIEETKESVLSSESLNDSIKAKVRDLWDSFDVKEYPNAEGKASTRSELSNAEIACYQRCEDLLNQYGYEGDEGWHFCPLADARQTLTDIGYSNLYNDLCYSSEFNHSTPSTSVLGWKYCTEKDAVGPLIQTSWHQGSPFNDYCHGHAAGCGAIAMAQVMNYHMKNNHYPSQFSYDGNTYNWGYFPAAALVKYVYNAIGTEYIDALGIEAVYTTPGNMEDGIKELGYKVSVSDDDPNRVEQEILSGHSPVIMLGNDTDLSFLPSPASYIGNSHYWICDGIRRMTQGKLYIFTEWQPNGNGNFIPGWGTINNPNNYGGVVYTCSHMNWGWGGKCNGWFINNTKPDSGNEYDNPNSNNTSNDDYKHNRKNFYIRWK